MKSNRTKDSIIFTAHTFIPDFNISNSVGFYGFADDMGVLYEKIKHTLFKDSVSKGKSPVHFKNDYLKQFGITARQFNSIRIDLQGNIDSIKEHRNLQIRDITGRISSIKKWIKNKQAKVKKLKKKDKDNSILNRSLMSAIHNKKRKLYALEQKLKKLKKDKEDNNVRICFSSKKLFRKQFNLTQNGYVLHDEWKEDWRSARNSSFMFVGSHEESSGNQTCKLSSDGKLRIRVPDVLHNKYGKYVTISDVRYPYGQTGIDEAIKTSKAITHRFVRGDKGWFLHSSVGIPERKPVTLKPRDIGCIGVDINEKEIAVSETDRFGNYIWSHSYPACVKDKTTEQTEAIYGDIVKDIIEHAVQTGKPMAYEGLDFQKKKSALKESGKRYSRMLSQLAYSTFIQMLTRRAYRFGVKTFSDNPAYTSVIGRFNYKDRYGISAHESAAIVMARRIQKYSESPILSPSRTASPLPVRNRGKHVWSFWRRLKDSSAIGDKYRMAGCNRRSSQDATASSESILPSSQTPVAYDNKALSVNPVCKSRGLCESGRESLTLTCPVMS